MSTNSIPQTPEEYTKRLIAIVDQEALKTSNGASDTTRYNLRAVKLAAIRKLEATMGDPQRQRRILGLVLATIATQEAK